MNAMWSEAKAGVSHRLATHLSVEPIRLPDETPMVGFTFDIAESAATTGAFDRTLNSNEWLICCSRDVAGQPGEAENPGSERGEGSAMRGRLNAFFAISVNSPSLSMVNFSCCVCSAPDPRACCVTRRVTPQPVRAAFRMKAGDHARL